MINPFDIIIEKLESIEKMLSESGKVLPLPTIEIIGTKEMCRRLAITEPTLIRWRSKGKIPAFNVGSSVRYNWHSVIDALENLKTK